LGRKSKYQSDFPLKVEKLANRGLNNKQIAKALGISVDTFIQYEKKYSLFTESLKKGRKIADEKVVNALFQRACGYSHPDSHITNYQGKITITSIIKHYPPDPTCLIFWLCNRMKPEWQSINKSEIGNIEKLDLKEFSNVIRNNYTPENQQ